MRGNRKYILLLTVLALLVVASPAMAAEEPSGPLDALGINAGFLIAQLINFTLLFGGLTLLLWSPIINFLDARAAKIQKGIEDAAAAATARRNAEAEAEKVIAQARAEASKLVEQGRERGEEVAKQVEAEARAEADKIRSDARAAAEVERNAELANLRGQVVNISTAIAQRLIGESLVDRSRQQSIINDFFTKVPADARGMRGEVEVISAMPLESGEQEAVKRELGIENVTFSVNPAILGGLIVRSGDRVVDGSVRSGLNDLTGRLN